MRVAQMRGNLTGTGFAGCSSRIEDRSSDTIRLRGRGEMQCGLRKVELCLGQPDELDSVRSGGGNEECLWVGESDVL